ncbi:MAG TPA: hypothetical protein VI653_13945 [Steroidobacteraceae bacterium]
MPGLRGQVVTRENIARAAVEPFAKVALPAPVLEKISKAARSADRMIY